MVILRPPAGSVGLGLALPLSVMVGSGLRLGCTCMKREMSGWGPTQTLGEGEPLRREPAPNTDVTIPSRPRNASSGPWAATPSLQRALSAWKRGRFGSGLGARAHRRRGRRRRGCRRGSRSRPRRPGSTSPWSPCAPSAARRRRRTGTCAASCVSSLSVSRPR